MRALMEGPEGFASSSSQMQAFASRTLSFLHLIESTVRSLETDSDVISSLASDCRATLEKVVASSIDVPLDPEGRVCELLEQGSATAARIYADAIRRREFARNDKALTDDDGVVEAYSKFIAAVADFHNAVEDLRDTIATVDASLQSGTGQTFKSADDLIAHLLSS